MGELLLAVNRQPGNGQPVEQASAAQATFEQATGEQATGEQAIVEFNGRHSKLSCFQPLVSPPACPSAAAAAAETMLFLKMNT